MDMGPARERGFARQMWQQQALQCVVTHRMSGCWGWGKEGTSKVLGSLPGAC